MFFTLIGGGIQLWKIKLSRLSHWSKPAMSRCINLFCTGTLEEKFEMIESKKALAEQVVGAGEEWLTELNTDQPATYYARSML